MGLAGEQMKVIVAGDRNEHDREKVFMAIRSSGFEITEIVSGGASGVDFYGEAYAHSKEIPLKVFKADWKAYGKSAGPIRNGQMAFYADALIAVWDGSSPGTKNMIEHMRKLKKPVFIFNY